MKLFIATLILTAFISRPALTQKQIQEAYYKSYNYEKLQDYKNAIKAIIPVYKEYPNGYTLNLRLGWLYYLNKNYANSIFYYDNAIKIAPGAVEPKLGYLLPLLAQQRYQEAETVASQILLIDYYNYYGNLRLAFTLRMEGKFSLAEKVVDKMLGLYPIDVSFLTEKALLYIAEKDEDNALKLFSDIIILDPENVTAKYYLNEKQNKK